MGETLTEKLGGILAEYWRKVQADNLEGNSLISRGPGRTIFQVLLGLNYFFATSISYEAAP